MLAIALFLLFAADAQYVRSIEQWRAEREASLKAPDGWLAVAGLFWLQEGENRFPEIAEFGDFLLSNGKVWLRRDGTSRQLEPDKHLVTRKQRTIFVIVRDKRIGIRLRDENAQARREFTGLHWFPVREDYRVKARFVPDRRKITVPNILGDSSEQESPGYAVFRIAGKEIRLTPVVEDGRLFFIFKDQTAGRKTYPAGRFLYADLPRDGTVLLDFNRAYNPPCAFTAFATCPLPPRENRLELPIEAGELSYGKH
jgi:uncharacterized protein (DUF1684 family)